VDYAEVDYGGSLVLVLGSEGSGLRPRVAAACDLRVSIPLRGRIESLSVSAAAAVLIFAVARNRQGNLQGA
jgi:23S rRNA (guanosine2251-2'-O)-methyltransferase